MDIGYVLLFVLCSIFWGVLIASLYIYIKTNPQKIHLYIPYPECKDGACVPQTLSNLFNDEFFNKYPASPLGYNMSDAGRWVEEYSEGVFRLTTIVKWPMLRADRFLTSHIIKDTIQQFKTEYKNHPSKYSLLVLSVDLQGGKKHCIGVVWDVSSTDCWIVDPAKRYTKNVTLSSVFEFYSVEEVGLVMMGVNVVALFPQQNLSHIIKDKGGDKPQR